MAQVTPLPAPPAPQPQESVILYGARLVQYLIAHETAALLTDEQIETADHAIGWLLARQPERDEQISPAYFARLDAARRHLTATRRYRADDAAQAAEPATPPQTRQPAQDSPNGDGGTREPARPFPPRLPNPGSVATPSTRNPQPAIDF